MFPIVPRAASITEVNIERLIGTTMGSVHVLPGTTHSSPKDKGDYNSEQNGDFDAG